MKSILSLFKNLKVVLALVLVLFVVLNLKNFNGLKKYKKLYNDTMAAYAYTTEVKDNEIRAVNMAANELKRILTTKDEQLSAYALKEKEMLKRLEINKKEINRLNEAIGISYGVRVDTFYRDSAVYVKNDSCVISYDDGNLDLHIDAVNGSSNVIYTYTDKIDIGIISIKYRKDGSEIKHPKLYFWKRWDTKARVKLMNPFANVDTLIYINNRK
jgi:hypothetical protein